VQELGGSIIAISPQLSKYTKQVVKKHQLTFPVLNDKDNGVADKFRLTFTLSPKLREVYISFGIDLERFNGNDSWQLPMPARFIIDRKGIVRSAEVHPDHTIRPEPSDIVDIMKSIN
jgi:peroxiredoxin